MSSCTFQPSVWHWCFKGKERLYQGVLAGGKTGLRRGTTSNGAGPTFLARLRKHRAASCTLEFLNGVLVHFSEDIDAQLLTRLLRAGGDK